MQLFWLFFLYGTINPTITGKQKGNFEKLNKHMSYEMIDARNPKHVYSNGNGSNTETDWQWKWSSRCHHFNKSENSPIVTHLLLNLEVNLFRNDMRFPDGPIADVSWGCSGTSPGPLPVYWLAAWRRSLGVTPWNVLRSGPLFIAAFGLTAGDTGIADFPGAVLEDVKR